MPLRLGLWAWWDQAVPGKPPHPWCTPGNALSLELWHRAALCLLGPAQRLHGAIHQKDGRPRTWERASNTRNSQCYHSPFLIWHLQGSWALGPQEENQERAVLAGKAEVLHHHHLPSQHPSSWPFSQILQVKLQERTKQLNERNIKAPARDWTAEGWWTRENPAGCCLQWGNTATSVKSQFLALLASIYVFIRCLIKSR